MTNKKDKINKFFSGVFFALMICSALNSQLLAYQEEWLAAYFSIFVSVIFGGISFSKLW